MGDCDSWKGNMDKVPFHVYAMKEPDYVMSLMYMYGTNLQTGKETGWMGVAQSNKRHSTTLRLWEIIFCTGHSVGNHFLYWDSVDDHNNKQHSPISLEVVWVAKSCLCIPVEHH